MSKYKILGMALMVPPGVIGLYFLIWVFTYTKDRPIIYVPVVIVTMLFLVFFAGLALYTFDEENHETK